MIEEEVAHRLVAAKIAVAGSAEDCAVEKALGRISAEKVTSRMPMPRFANSMVDGYALPAGNHAVGDQFQMIGEQAAGVDQGLRLDAGQCLRIFTGAPLPEGTGSVLMQEVAALENDHVVLKEAIEEGDGCRQAGDDLLAGQTILSRGDLLTPQRIALVVSQGVTTVSVRKHPRVHVISTGDELRPLGEELAPGELYESNAAMLCLAGGEKGWTGWTRSHVRDDPAVLREAMAQAAKENDFLFLSGGVSVGDHDHVRSELEALGFEEHFWRVRVQPGKPVLFGTLGHCHVLGLPGNPVSSFVSFHLFGVPAICHWLGVPVPGRRKAVLAMPVSNPGRRPHYLRGRFDPLEGVFSPVGLQRSHGMLGLSKANALARIPEAVELAEGSEVEVVLV